MFEGQIVDARKKLQNEGVCTVTELAYMTDNQVLEKLKIYYVIVVPRTLNYVTDSTAYAPDKLYLIPRESFENCDYLDWR